MKAATRQDPTRPLAEKERQEPPRTRQDYQRATQSDTRGKTRSCKPPKQSQYTIWICFGCLATPILFKIANEHCQNPPESDPTGPKSTPSSFKSGPGAPQEHPKPSRNDPRKSQASPGAFQDKPKTLCPYGLLTIDHDFL